MTRDEIARLLEEICALDRGADYAGVYTDRHLVGWNKASRKKMFKLVDKLAKKHGFEIIHHACGEHSLKEA